MYFYLQIIIVSEMKGMYYNCLFFKYKILYERKKTIGYQNFVEGNVVYFYKCMFILLYKRKIIDYIISFMIFG